MKPASAKAKGRRLQNAVRDAVEEAFGLERGDVKSAVMGESGVDLHLSPAAKRKFPYAVECKAVERLNVWDAYDQAVENGKKVGLEPLLVMKRNRSKTLAVVDFGHLLRILKGGDHDDR